MAISADKQTAAIFMAFINTSEKIKNTNNHAAYQAASFFSHIHTLVIFSQCAVVKISDNNEFVRCLSLTIQRKIRTSSAAPGIIALIAFLAERLSLHSPCE
jgi:hypothetical protein